MKDLTPNPSRALVILYGSETGTAQDYAHELSHTAERHHFDTRVMSMNDLDLTLLPRLPLIIFITSTTGQGDLPANTSKFWKFLLRKKLPGTFLSGVWFSSFGLGDSAYLKFNCAVKKLHKRVLQLGGREVCARGEGDEQHAEGIDGTWVPWVKGLLEKLGERYPLPQGMKVVVETELLPEKYVLGFVGEEGAREMEAEIKGGGGGDGEEVYIHRKKSQLATVVHNARVTTETHFQDVRHISFATDKDISYSPGDVLSLSPQNLAKDVTAFISLQGWEQIADKPLRITPTPYLNSLLKSSTLPPPKPPISNPVSPLTIRTLLIHHLDITAIPRRLFFSHIANYTDDTLHKERLLEFVDPEYIDELWDYTTRPRRTIIEVLQEFDSVKLDWRTALLGEGGIGLIRERLFSICSSQKGGHLSMPRHQHQSHEVNGVENGESHSPPTPLPCNRSIEILVAIVKYQTILKKPRTGLCTRWLTTLRPGSRVNILITANAGGTGFSARAISDELEKPVVMIGPGTGVAPMRSLAWERLGLAAQEGGKRSVGDMLVFFGCRNQDADFFFRDEWERWQMHSFGCGGGEEETGSGDRRSGKRHVYVAFSRDQKRKRYVQHLVREHAELVFRLVHDEQGVVYVCGSSGKMPQAVREALVEILERGGKGEGKEMDREGAERYLTTMEREGRYRQETW